MNFGYGRLHCIDLTEYFKGLLAFIVQLNCDEEYNLMAYNDQMLLYRYLTSDMSRMKLTSYYF